MNNVGRQSKIPPTMEAGDLAPWVAAFAAELEFAASHEPDHRRLHGLRPSFRGLAHLEQHRDR